MVEWEEVVNKRTRKEGGSNKERKRAGKPFKVVGEEEMFDLSAIMRSNFNENLNRINGASYVVICGAKDLTMKLFGHVR